MTDRERAVKRFLSLQTAVQVKHFIAKSTVFGN